MANEVQAGDVSVPALIDAYVAAFPEPGCAVLTELRDVDAQEVAEFTEVRELRRRLEEQGVAIATRANPAATGPAHFVVEHPDGNPILVDQHR